MAALIHQAALPAGQPTSVAGNGMIAVQPLERPDRRVNHAAPPRRQQEVEPTCSVLLTAGRLVHRQPLRASGRTRTPWQAKPMGTTEVDADRQNVGALVRGE